MCLILESGLTPAKIAEKDITVYKVLLKKDDELLTFYQEFPVKIGKTYYSKLEKRINEPFVVIGLHSFIEKRDATYKKNSINKDVVVAECVIPKGSSYYEGIFYSNGTLCDSIASDTLKYVRIF